MKHKWTRFFRYELLILLIAILILLINGCIHRDTFFRTPTEKIMTRDYLENEIAQRLDIRSESLAQYDAIELDIINRLGLNGLLALKKNPAGIKRLYIDLKDFELFYDIIEEYGPHHIVPVLDYFYEKGNVATDIELAISDVIENVFHKTTSSDSLSERQKRLLLILKEIDYQKHNFLSRFAFNESGAHRNYVTTVTSTVVNFFTGGLANFNAAVITRGIDEVTTEELIDAGIDILILIPFAAYLTKSGKAAGSTLKGGTVVGRTGSRAIIRSTTSAAAATKLGRISQGIFRVIPVHTLFQLKNVKWYLLALAAIKPDLINHGASLVARALSVPPILIKFGFWLLILFPLLNVLIFLILMMRGIWRNMKRIFTPVRNQPRTIM